jgi:hypothetical protein
MGGACLGLCGWHLVVCLGGRALLIQRSGAEQDAGDDGLAAAAAGPQYHQNRVTAAHLDGQ